MIIYLEGPDGSGKSTLADAIAKDLKSKGYEVDRFAERNVNTHPQRPYRLNKEHLFDELKYMAKDSGIHILDRGPLSDCIYRIFDDYKPVAGLVEYLPLFKEFSNNGQLVMIYCYTPMAEQAMRERGDDNPVALTRHRELTRCYNMVMGVVNKALHNRVHYYNFMKSKNEIDSMVKEVENSVDEHFEHNI